MARSQREKYWLAGGALIALVLVVIGWFFFIGPQRSQTSDVDARTDTARTQNATLQANIGTLRNQTEHLGTYRASLASAQLALPSTSGLSDFLRTLQKLGNSTTTDVSALTVGAPVNVSAVAATATPSSAQTGPAVYGLPITAQVAGSPAALNRFLQQLQTVQPRAVLITQITEGTGTTAAGGAGSGTGAGTTLQLTMQVFVAPSSPGEQAQLAGAAH